MTDRTLLLGLGAAKSGTSWLFEALRAHPECHLRSVKELHYFDSVDAEAHAQALAQMESSSAGILARIAEEPERFDELSAKLGDLEAAMTLHLGEGADRATYLDYLSHDAGQARVIGEVTPSYALLSVEALGEMARLTPDVRAIYVMRDPVERMWSHVRMHAARLPDGRADHAAAVRRTLDLALSGELPEITSRGDYAGAIVRIRSAFGADALHLVFAEDMFTDAGFARICRFLAIAPKRAPERRVHAGRPIAPTHEDTERMLDFLAPQYDFVARETGALPQAWQKHLTRV